MKIQLPTRKDGKDGATHVADEAKAAAADAADELRNRALELGTNASEAINGFAADASVAVKDFGTDFQVTKHVGSAAADIGTDMAKGLQEATSATGQMLRDAAHGITNGNGRWFRLARFRAPRTVDLPETRRRIDALRAAAASGALSLGRRLAKASGRAILPRPATPLQRVGFAIPIVGVVIVAAGTGAVLAYAFDPVSGRARRARARDQISAGARRLGRRLGRTQRYVTSTMAGKVEQMRASRREIAAEAESRPRSDFDMAHTRSPELAGVMSGPATGNGLG